MSNRQSIILLSLFLFSILPNLGCRPRTPVNEVTLDQSGVEVEQRDLSSLSQQWPQWRGRNGDGIVPSLDGSSGMSTIPTRWTESDNMKWETAIPGRGHSSPIVVGGQVVLATAKDEEQKQMVVAFDESTGELKWERLIHEGGFPNNRELHSKSTNANGTVASDGQTLVTAFLNAKRIVVTALDMAGEPVWQTDIGAFASRFGYAPSPVIYQSLVIVAADNGGGGYLVGLDLQSGTVAWRRDRGNVDSYSSPRIAKLDGQYQLLITGGGRMVSYDPANGEIHWETPCISDATCGTVVTAGDRIFASGGYPDKETVCLSANGEKLWSNRTKIYEPSMITDGQSVFAFSDDGIAMCWAASDGELQWKKRLGGKFSGSPMLIDNRVYVADLSGNTYVIEATGEEYQLVSKNQLGSDCYASPSVANGCLYLRVGVGEGDQRTEKLVCLSNVRSREE